MDRQAFQTGQLIPNGQLLAMEKGKLVALGYALEAVMGAGGTVVSGLACTPTTSPSLSVVVGRGSIMTTTAIDGVAYSDLGTDTNATIKQGILQEPGVTLTLTPPSTAGYSQVYLIQAKQSDADTATTVPFYNASNPAQPYNGPGNSGNATLTLRQSQCVVSLKQGAAAATGSQITPSPDVGNVGLYTITLVNGQTQITAGQIVQLASAPFVPVPLPQVPAGVQSGAWLYAVDTGASGALAATLSPVPTSLPDGMEVHIKAGHAAAGSDTFNLNGLGALPIQRRGGAIPAAGDWVTNDIISLRKLGSAWQISGLVPSDVVALIPTVTRVNLRGNMTIYVRPDGSDSNNGLANTPAGAFQTIAGAWSRVCQLYNLSGYTLTIQLGATGTYAGADFQNYGVGGNIILNGDTANQSGYVITPITAGAQARCVSVSVNTVTVQGVTLDFSSITSGSGYALWTHAGGQTIWSNSTIKTTASNTSAGLIAIDAGGVMFTANNVATLGLNTGSVSQVVQISPGGSFGGTYGGTSTAWNTTNIAFTVFMNCLTASAILTGISFTYANVSGQRYTVSGNGTINSGGAGVNALPGTSAGATATGGQYL